MAIDQRRVCVISFDFKQHKERSQARKTRFFRELYGYTQQVKQKLKDGAIVARSYHYPGVMDKLPYAKLGRSVLAVQPGSEDSIIQLLRAFDEVEFYTFIGWLPTSLWPIENEIKTSTVSNLIATYGYLSILVQITQHGEGVVTHATLLDEGFDMSYITRAIQYLIDNKLLIKDREKLNLTSKAKQLINQIR